MIPRGILQESTYKSDTVPKLSGLEIKWRPWSNFRGRPGCQSDLPRLFGDPCWSFFQNDKDLETVHSNTPNKYPNTGSMHHYFRLGFYQIPDLLPNYPGWLVGILLI